MENININKDKRNSILTRQKAPHIVAIKRPATLVSNILLVTNEYNF